MRKEGNVVHRHKASLSLNLCYDPVRILLHFYHLQHIHTINYSERTQQLQHICNQHTYLNNVSFLETELISLWRREWEKRHSFHVGKKQWRASTEACAQEWKETRRRRRPAVMPEWPQSAQVNESSSVRVPLLIHVTKWWSMSTWMCWTSTQTLGIKRSQI